MPERQSNSRLLRELAEELVQTMAEELEVPEQEQQDLVTSLVRQWITYDGNATIFVEEEQVYLVLDRTPLGEPGVHPEPAEPGWLGRVTRDWKISPEDLPDAMQQLNRGQSAEVTSTEGVPLRLWVNPRERSKGIEPLVKQPTPPGKTRDYHKIAADQVEQKLGHRLKADEIADLVCSVAQKWQKYEGHASLFIGGQELVLTLTELPEGCSQVTTEQRATDVESLLGFFGFTPETIPEVLAQINLDQEVEFRDRRGVRSLLWHDPRAGQLCWRTLDGPGGGAVPSTTHRPTPPAAPTGARPIMCPHCSAVLNSWGEGQRQQLCPLCGRSVALPD